MDWVWLKIGIARRRVWDGEEEEKEGLGLEQERQIEMKRDI